MHEIDHLPEGKTRQRSPRFPRLSVANEEWSILHGPIEAMVHLHQAMPLGIVGNSPTSWEGMEHASVCGIPLLPTIAAG